VIQDSHPWKRELKKTARWLKTLRLTEAAEEKQLVRLEKELFFAAYVIRKLRESNKLTDSVANRRLKLEAYALLEQVTLINQWKWTEVCDQENLVQREISVIKLCHQFVHSFVFSPVFDEHGVLDSVVVASDWQSKDALLRVAAEQLIDVLESVAEDVVTESHYKRDASGKETITLA